MAAFSALAFVSAHPVGAAPAGQRDRATLATFAGRWTGHIHTLVVTRSGTAREVIYDTCCRLVIRLSFVLSRPRGTSQIASATGTITSVQIGKFWASPFRRPRVGEQLTLRLRGGAIREGLTGELYCGSHMKNPYVCGA